MILGAGSGGPEDPPWEEDENGSWEGRLGECLVAVLDGACKRRWRGKHIPEVRQQS